MTTSDAHGGSNGLLDALAAHPDAKVTAIDPSGEFCPMPEGLATDHEVLEAASAFEVFPKSEWPRIIGGWQLVQQYGAHVGTVLGPDGEPVSVLTYDARDRYGVFVMLVVPDASVAAASHDEERPLVSRFGTYERDMLGVVVGMDVAAQRLLGWEPGSLDDVKPTDVIHPDDRLNAEANWLATLVNETPQRWRGRHLHADGSYRWIEFTNTNRLEDLGHVVSEMMDISEEMETALALRRREELLARLNDALPLGVVEVDVDRRVLYANDRVGAVVGVEDAETLDDLLAAVDAADRPVLDAFIARTLLKGDDADLEVRLSGPDHAAGDEGARVCSVAVRALRDEGEITGAVLCISDITEAAVLRRELQRQATLDRLTGCHNRAATLTALEEALAANDGERGTAVLFIDLDRFKPVNDALGHAAGDNLLVIAAQRLHALVRAGDVVGRMGGDEFVIVCPRTDRAAADVLAERITATLAEPVALAGVTTRIGASVGVAWSADPATTADAIVAAADAAMYTVKRERHAANGARASRAS